MAIGPDRLAVVRRIRGLIGRQQERIVRGDGAIIVDARIEPGTVFIIGGKISLIKTNARF